MARETRQYDPAQVIVNVGGVDISGYAAGTFVEMERNVDAVTLVVGSDGESTRVRSQNRSGMFKITLQQSSPSNDVLSALATNDENGDPTAVVPVLVKDANGTTLGQAKQAWIKKKPNSPFSDSAENREWQLETGNLDYTVGGEALLGA